MKDMLISPPTVFDFFSNWFFELCHFTINIHQWHIICTILDWSDFHSTNKSYIYLCRNMKSSNSIYSTDKKSQHNFVLKLRYSCWTVSPSRSMFMVFRCRSSCSCLSEEKKEVLKLRYNYHVLCWNNQNHWILYQKFSFHIKP